MNKKEWKLAAEEAQDAAKYWIARYHEDTDDLIEKGKELDAYKAEIVRLQDLAMQFGIDAVKYAVEADEIEIERKNLQATLKTLRTEKQEILGKLSDMEDSALMWEARYYSVFNEKFDETMTEPTPSTVDSDWPYTCDSDCDCDKDQW